MNIMRTNVAAPNNNLLETNVAVSSDAEEDQFISPFMKLVDAAAATLSYDKKESMVNQDKGDLEPTKSCSDVANDIENMNSHSSLDPNLDNDSSKSNDHHLNEEEQETVVIVGTKDDLVRHTEKKASFAEFLMNVIDDEVNNNDFIRWMPDGLSFTITNHKKFTMDRMPKLFKIRNMSSFVRKLTRWGFHRVLQKETGNCDIFQHEYFIKGKPELVKKIRCLGRAAEVGQGTANNNNGGVSNDASIRENERSIVTASTAPSNAHQVESGMYEHDQFPIPAPTRNFITPMTSKDTLINDDLNNEKIGTKNSSELMTGNVRFPQLQGISERRHLLARQEEMRRAILARQEAELDRQEMLDQKQYMMNGMSSSEYLNSSIGRSFLGKDSYQNSTSFQGAQMSHQEILRQEQQLQLQQRKLIQQQRALEQARLRHDQELRLLQQATASSSIPSFNRNNIDMNLEADLMNASTRSLDFLGSSCRSLDLMGISGRALDFLGISNRSSSGLDVSLNNENIVAHTSPLRQRQQRQQQLLMEQQTSGGRGFGTNFMQAQDNNNVTSLLGNSDKMLNNVSMSERDIISMRNNALGLESFQRQQDVYSESQRQQLPASYLSQQSFSISERDEMIRLLRSNTERRQVLSNQSFDGGVGRGGSVYPSTSDLINRYSSATTTQNAVIEQEKRYQQLGVNNGQNQFSGSQWQL